MIKIKDVMSTDVLTVKKSELVITAARKLETTSYNFILVLERDKPIGILTKRDILKSLIHRKNQDETVEEAMTKPVLTIEADKSLTEALELMKKRGIVQIPVMKDNKYAGMITEEDVIEGLIKSEDVLTQKLITGKIKQKTYAKKQQNLFKEIGEIKKAQKKLSTGSTALDKILEGGFPYGKPILIYGMLGAGKSMFAYSFLAEGLRSGDICVYTYSTETIDEIKDGLKFTGLEDVDNYEKKEKIVFLQIKENTENKLATITSDTTTEHLYTIKKAIKEAIQKKGPGVENVRFVFNVFLSLLISCDTKTVYYFLSDLIGFLKENEVTAMFLLQKGTGNEAALAAIEELMNVVIELDVTGDGVKIDRCMHVIRSGSAKLAMKPIKFSFKKGKGFSLTR